MNTDMDDLIRHAVRRQEQLAVDPARIRAALPARAARRRRTRNLATVAAMVTAAAVAVAVTVPGLAMRDADNGSAPATFAASEPTGIPMLYRPTWLPDGMVEVSRSVPLRLDATNGWAWEWQNPSWDVTLLVTFERTNGGLPDANVDINGTPGRYRGGEQRASVVWPADDHVMLWLTTRTGGIPEEVLLQIARSVKPDPTQLRPPMRLGLLPAGVDGDPVLRVARDAWPTRWKATILVGDNPERNVSVSIGAPTEKASGETVTVNGGTAHLNRGLLTMDLGDGRQLVVRMSDAALLTRNELIQIVESIRLDPNPDVAWLGR